MSDFDARLFMPVLPDGQHYNVFDAKFKDIRFRIPSRRSIVIDSSNEGNLPLIAHLELGDQKLWWVLLQYNGLFDGLEDVKPGLVLRIPDRTALRTLLQAGDDQDRRLVL